jgi:hypothetical protein
VNETRSCNYNEDTPDDERYYSSKHVEQGRNNGIINYPTQLHLVGHFYKNTGIVIIYILLLSLVCLGDTGNRPVLPHALQLISKFWYKLMNYRISFLIHKSSG